MGLQQQIFVLTDITGLLSDANVECPIGNSDHNIIHFSVNIEHDDITNNADILFYNYKDADYDSLNCLNVLYQLGL